MAIDIKTQLYFDPTDRESLTLKMNSEELDVFPLKKKDRRPDTSKQLNLTCRQPISCNTGGVHTNL
jgi:hypothetical protein